MENNQHITVAEYRRITSQVESKPEKTNKKNKVSDNIDNPTEHTECIDLVYHLNQLKDEGKIVEFTHISNETFTKSWNQKRKNVAEGVKKGVPDYLIITAPRFYPGKAVVDEELFIEPGQIMHVETHPTYEPGKIIFIEMKRKHSGTVSPEQKQWIEAINKAGGYATVAKGADMAIEFIEGLI